MASVLFDKGRGPGAYILHFVPVALYGERGYTTLSSQTSTFPFNPGYFADAVWAVLSILFEAISALFIPIGARAFLAATTAAAKREE